MFCEEKKCKKCDSRKECEKLNKAVGEWKKELAKAVPGILANRALQANAQLYVHARGFKKPSDIKGLTAFLTKVVGLYLSELDLKVDVETVCDEDAKTYDINVKKVTRAKRQ